MEKIGRTSGPAISDVQGEMYTSVELDQMLKEVLEETYEEDSSLFPPDIKQVDDIASSYHCFRSLRQASDTRALEMKVEQTDIDCINRWGQDQRNTHGIKIQMPMRQHYAEPELLVRPLLRYTLAM